MLNIISQVDQKGWCVRDYLDKGENFFNRPMLK